MGNHYIILPIMSYFGGFVPPLGLGLLVAGFGRKLKRATNDGGLSASAASTRRSPYVRPADLKLSSNKISIQVQG